LCGGGSLIANINQYLSKNLGITVDFFNPFEKINVGTNKISNPQLYAVAVGLALPSEK
jgi:Tfp pilus assembly PilM family ATPase